MNLDASGRRVEKRGGYVPCDVCAESGERGWIKLRGDWMQCPQCFDSARPGHVHVEATRITPTRKLILPTREGIIR